MKDEILAGLRNAMERGQSLETATQSFINAGYNPQEVREAARSLSGGVSEIIYPNSAGEDAGKRETPDRQMLPRENPYFMNKRRNGNGSRILVIGLIIISLLVFLGALGYLLYSLVLQ